MTLYYLSNIYYIYFLKSFICSFVLVKLYKKFVKQKKKEYTGNFIFENYLMKSHIAIGLIFMLSCSFAYAKDKYTMTPYIGGAFHTLKGEAKADSTVSYTFFGNTITQSTSVETSTTESGFALNGGLMLNDRSKINGTYLLFGFDDIDGILVTYDYIFGKNHTGFMVGGGINSTSYDSSSKVLPIVKLGYEHKFKKKIYFEGGYIHYLGKIEESEGATDIEVEYKSHLYFGANYLF
jgi:hypothetical protein